jgi:hypothetical protein
VSVVLDDRRTELHVDTARLLAIARDAAASLGRRPTPAPAPPGARRHARIRCTPDHDVWVIVWGPDSGVDLHDHGGSAGAFALAHGELTETAPDDAPTHARRVVAGEGRTIEPGTLHAVRNLARSAAVSIHVYSPPLETMGFYDDEQREIRREVVV